jgi:hypothetical protein
MTSNLFYASSLRGGTTKQSADLKLKRFIINKAGCFVPRNDGRGNQKVTSVICKEIKHRLLFTQVDSC